MALLILEENFSGGSARSSRPGPTGTFHGPRCGCSSDVANGQGSMDARSASACERSPRHCIAVPPPRNAVSRDWSRRGSSANGRRRRPDVGFLRSLFRSRSSLRAAATTEERNCRGSNGRVCHLGSHPVPPGVTGCAIWGHEVCHLGSQEHGTRELPWSSHGGRQRKPSPWRAPVPPPGRRRGDRG